MQLYLTPNAVGYLTQLILAALIAGYVLWLARKPQRPQHVLCLACFFCLITLFIATMFLDTASMPSSRLLVVYTQNTLMAVAVICLTQFAYHFPALPATQRREAQGALLVNGLYTLWEAGYAVYRFVMLGRGVVLFRPNWGDPLLLIQMLWVAVIFLRRLLAVERREPAAAPFPAALLHPATREGRTLRNFALTFLLVAALSLFNVLHGVYLVSGSFASLGVSLGTLIALFIFAIAYLNGQPEATSSIIRLVGATLTLMLALLGIVGWVISPFAATTFQPALPAGRTLRFTPNAGGGYDVATLPLTFLPPEGETLHLIEAGTVAPQENADCSRPLEFTFPFYGETYRQIYVCNDGALGLGQSLSYKSYQYHYGVDAPLIMALLVDLYPDISPGDIVVQVTPERLVATWSEQLSFRQPRASYTFQSVLNADGAFDLSYADLPTDLTYQPNDDPLARPWAIGALPGGARGEPDTLHWTAAPAAGGPEGIVQDYLLAYRQHLHSFLAPLAWLILVPSTLIVLGLPLLIYESLVRPLNALLFGVRRLSAGDYSSQVPVYQQDEIGFLADAFNRMAAELNALIHGLETRVTERTAALNDLTLRLRAELKEREELITELQAFSHTVAHDLKAPLSIITGYSALLAAAPELNANPELVESADYTMKAAFRMSHMIDSILTFAHVRQADLEPVAVNMAELIAEVAHDLAPLVVEAGASLSYPQAWPKVLGDPQWVQAMWTNYISNALKYGGRPDEGLAPRIELGFNDAGDGAIRFWVRDHGPGLTPEQQALLFMPFKRLDQNELKGTGLGLSIVKRMAERMGGQVGVESAPGAGCRFWFSLPR